MNTESRFLPLRWRSLVLAGTMGWILLPGAHGQTTDAPATQLEKIEVTGSSIKRLDVETALPVQTLRREDIERSGATSVEELFR